MIFCLLKNQKHGKPPTSEDYRKVARELYKKNVGAPIQGLAEQIKISRKVFTKYVSDLVEAFKEEKKASILELNSAGTPATKISHILQEKFRDGKGTSDSQVLDFLKKEKAAKAGSEDQDDTNADAKNASADTESGEDNAGNGAKVEGEIEPTEPLPKPVELKVVYGNLSDTIMITGLSSLLPELQEKLKSLVEDLVNKIREENCTAQEDKEDPDQDNPEDQDKAPENLETDVNSNQVSKEKSTVQKI